MTSRSACFFKDGDFGIDEWPTVARTEEGDIRRRSSHTRKGALPAGSKEGTSASTRGVGTSASVRSRAPAKVSERDTGGKGVYNQWIHCDLIVIF